MKQRLTWINTIKAVCMLGVYLLHSREYINEPNSYVMMFIHPFYVNAFFVVSGILFFRKWLNLPGESIHNCLIISYKNIFYKLIIPTIIFSSIFFIPKLLYKSSDVSLGSYFDMVFGGQNFWFTSAMVISQLTMLTTIASIKRCNLLVFMSLSIVIIISMPILKHYFPQHFPWFWKSGLAAISFLTLGGIIYLEHNILKRYKISLLAFSIFTYLIAIIYSLSHTNISYALLSVRFNFVGTCITLSGIAFIIIICYIINPKYRILQFIGENSIVFYFFSGCIPATLSSISFVRNSGVWIFFLICITIGVLLTWIVVKYLPFLTDLRKFKCLKK